MQCYVIIVLTPCPILTSLHFFWQEDMRVFRTLGLGPGPGVVNHGTRAELGTRALLSGTWARPRKRDPSLLKVSVSSISFVNNSLFNLTLICFWCHMATDITVSAALRTPDWWGGTLQQRPKIQTPHHKFGWHAEEFCHWFSRFRQANRRRLPAPDLG